MCPGQTFCPRLGLGSRKWRGTTSVLGDGLAMSFRGKWEIVRRCQSGEHVTRSGWRREHGGDYSRAALVCPTPTSCPPNCSCHHILPSRGQGAPVGAHGPGTRSGTSPCPSAPGTSAVSHTSGPRHPGSQRRTLLCHTDLDRFLFDSAIPHPNSGLKWSCRIPDSTPVLGCRGSLCRNEVEHSVHSSDSHGCGNTFAKRVPRQLCILAGTRELVRRVL